MLAEAKNKTRSYRRWSPDERRAIVEESYAANASVSAVARKHGVSAVSLYLWRKEHAAGTDAARDAADPVALPYDDGLASARERTEPAVSVVKAESLETRDQAVVRVQELERQLAQLQADLAYSRRQRALLVGVLTSIGSQLRLLAELEDNADHASAAHESQGHDR